MGEKTTLGHLCRLGQIADAQTLEAHLAGQLHGLVENPVLGVLALGHENENSTTVRICQCWHRNREGPTPNSGEASA